VKLHKIGHSVLYEVTGTDSLLKPYLLAAHMDVVPPEGEWSVEPFSGEIRDNYIYGRGAIDNKCSLTSQLEALRFSFNLFFIGKQFKILF
jgi:carboxypeptidase PM20D1